MRVPLPETLTLSTTPARLERLATEPIEGAGPAGCAQRRRAVYWDTARLALWRRGIALAVERDGSEWFQRIEFVGQALARTLSRSDAAQALAGAEPDVSRLADPQARAAVRSAALTPIFRVEFERRVRELAPAQDSVIELRLDRGAILAGRRRERLCEIELEAKRGAAWRLYEAALALETLAATDLETRSRAERGYALVRGTGSGPVKADPAVVREAMTAIEAFREICLTCVAHMNANRAGMLAGTDPEYLHQMRVALRRFRSAFSVFSRLLPRQATRAPVEEIRSLARALGPARDWDVVMSTMLDPLARQLPGHRGLEALRARLQAERARTQAAARRAVRSRRYTRFVLGLLAWLGSEPWNSVLPLAEARALRQPVRAYAVRALARLHRRVRKRGRHLASLDAAALHRLRIAVKKLRYAAQFFAPLFTGGRDARMRAALEALQDALGGINDCATAEQYLRAARARRRAGPGTQAEALVRHWIEAAQREHRRRLKAAWKSFRNAKPYWED